MPDLLTMPSLKLYQTHPSYNVPQQNHERETGAYVKPLTGASCGPSESRVGQDKGHLEVCSA